MQQKAMGSVTQRVRKEAKSNLTCFRCPTLTGHCLQDFWEERGLQRHQPCRRHLASRPAVLERQQKSRARCC